MAFTSPLDLEYWLITTFAGSTTIFFIVSVISIFMLMATFRMPIMITLAVFSLYIIVFSGTILVGELSGLKMIMILGLTLGIAAVVIRMTRSN